MISALLLAAGSSTRMGQPKAFLPIRNQPAIRHCLTTLGRSPVQEIIVVLGPGSEAAAPLLADLPVTVVLNTLPRSEMAASVRLGIQAMRPDAAGALISLVDHPLVQAETLEQLTAAAAAVTGADYHSHISGSARPPDVFSQSALKGNLSGT